MALIGFPNQIEVVAGSGWTSLLTPSETIILNSYGGEFWSENGTGTPGPTNRIRLWAASLSAEAKLHKSYSGVFLGGLGYARDSATDYTFLNIWNGGLTLESWYGAIASGSNYNPDVFSLMREYGAEPPTGIPWAYSRGKSQVIGGGLR